MLFLMGTCNISPLIKHQMCVQKKIGLSLNAVKRQTFQQSIKNDSERSSNLLQTTAFDLSDKTLVHLTRPSKVKELG